MARVIFAGRHSVTRTAFRRLRVRHAQPRADQPRSAPLRPASEAEPLSTCRVTIPKKRSAKLVFGLGVGCLRRWVTARYSAGNFCKARLTRAPGNLGGSAPARGGASPGRGCTPAESRFPWSVADARALSASKIRTFLHKAARTLSVRQNDSGTQPLRPRRQRLSRL
jgi:hypothetical protein